MECIVLAGGLGTRLSGCVPDRPKCLAPVGGRPFLAWQLDWLERQVFDHVVLSLGFRSDDVISWLSENNTWPITIDYVVEDAPLGTGGAISYAMSKCIGDRVFVFNGDTIVNIDCRKMLGSSAPVTIALKPMKDFDRYGSVEYENGYIKAFNEKAYCAEGLINAGAYLISENIFGDMGLDGRFSFETEVLQPLAAKGRLGGVVEDVYFIDIGVPGDYEKSQVEIPLLFKTLKISEKVLSSDASYLFLDRDGVINIHRPNDYVKTLSEFVFMPGIKEALKAWSERFSRIVIVTNQRGVGRGVMTEESLFEIHRKMVSEITSSGGRIDGIFTCISVSPDDPRRKPNPGLFRDACEAFPELSAERSVMVGDSDSDREFANNCGMSFIEFR